MSIPRPPENFTISCDEARALVKAAREKILADEKELTFTEIAKAAKNGRFYLTHQYPDKCKSQDIEEFGKELSKLGFEVKFKAGVNDILEITWYPKD
jgi:hypothetical protein